MALGLAGAWRVSTHSSSYPEEGEEEEHCDRHTLSIATPFGVSDARTEAAAGGTSTWRGCAARASWRSWGGPDIHRERNSSVETSLPWMGRDKSSSLFDKSRLARLGTKAHHWQTTHERLLRFWFGGCAVLDLYIVSISRKYDTLF